MQPIYRSEDFHEANRAYRKVWLVLVAIVVLTLGADIAAMVLRMAWLGYAATTLGVLAALLYWGVVGQPVLCYHRYINDVDQGMERWVEGVVEQIGTDVEVDQSIETVSVIVLEEATGDMKRPVQRQLHYDCNKLPVPFAVGQRVKLTLFGNNIKGYEIKQ